MSMTYKQRLAIQYKDRKRLLEINPTLTDESGIYILKREDEEGFKYAYIGQAKHVLSRLVQHLSGYQHIDLSIRKHGFYSLDNPTGWKVSAFKCDPEKLDAIEKEYIKLYADRGYQLRNKTSGSQHEGKCQIDEYKPSKGYRDGLEQGKKNLARDLQHIIDKHLVVQLRPEKQNNKVSQRQLDKFWELLGQEGEQQNDSCTGL